MLDPAGIRSLIEAGEEKQAVERVESAAGAGEAEALAMLADWRLYGLYGPQDLELSYDLFGKAAQAGHRPSALTRAYLTAAGLGCPADLAAATAMVAALASDEPEAARQMAILPDMPPEESAAVLERQPLWPEPRIELVKGLVSAAECAYLRALGEPELRPALTIDPATGAGIPNPVRTSWAMSVLPHREDLVVHRINRRIAVATGTRFSCGEPLNLLRYAPGQQYRPHHDGLVGAANQRVMTALVYLNEDYEGGQTDFPYLGVTGRGATGDALVFVNALPDGERDDRAYHAGLAVTGGVKWLATRWIRQYPYPPT